MYGGFYSKRFSWTRLALHFCDETKEKERQIQGKKHIKCKPRNETIAFFGKHIISLDVTSKSPVLKRSSEGQNRY